MNKDDYGEVINGEETFEWIAAALRNLSPVLVGWSDENGGHLDILFVIGAVGEGPIQGGVKRTDLLVSLMRRGAFGFETDNENTYPGYYGEKLNWSGAASLEKLGELINEVKARI